MNRRGLFKRLACGAGAVVGACLGVKTAEAKKPLQTVRTVARGDDLHVFVCQEADISRLADLVGRVLAHPESSDPGDARLLGGLTVHDEGTIKIVSIKWYKIDAAHPWYYTFKYSDLLACMS